MSAALGEDPQSSGTLLVYVAVTAVASLPLGVAYRVTVVCVPEARRPPVTPSGWSGAAAGIEQQD